MSVQSCKEYVINQGDHHDHILVSYTSGTTVANGTNGFSQKSSNLKGDLGTPAALKMPTLQKGHTPAGIHGLYMEMHSMLCALRNPMTSLMTIFGAFTCETKYTHVV